MSDIVQRMRDAAARNKPAYCLDAAELRALADLVEAGRKYKRAVQEHDRVVFNDYDPNVAATTWGAVLDSQPGMFDALARLDGEGT